MKKQFGGQRTHTYTSPDVKGNAMMAVRQGEVSFTDTLPLPVWSPIGTAPLVSHRSKTSALAYRRRRLTDGKGYLSPNE
jgi:hypothetical protein